jgi:pyridoxal phosphate enzyme (YggS family)
MSIDVPAVAVRLELIRARIRRALGPGADRRVDIVAVTKSFGPEAYQAAAAVGLVDVGENYAQELVAKHAELPAGLVVHFIGQLQTNKVRLVAPCVDVYESVDRPSLATEIARRAPGAAVLVQVDTSGGLGKGGCAIGDVPALAAHCSDLGLEVLGLMAVGPTTGGPEAARPGFRQVRHLVDELGLSVCSMGMSDDLEVAVEEGSTQVRVGSALFGARPSRR